MAVRPEITSSLPAAAGALAALRLSPAARGRRLRSAPQRRGQPRRLGSRRKRGKRARLGLQFCWRRRWGVEGGKDKPDQRIQCTGFPPRRDPRSPFCPPQGIRSSLCGGPLTTSTISGWSRISLSATAPRGQAWPHLEAAEKYTKKIALNAPEHTAVVCFHVPVSSNVIGVLK